MLRVSAFRLLSLCGDRSARRRSVGACWLLPNHSAQWSAQTDLPTSPHVAQASAARRPRRSRPPNAPGVTAGDMNQCAGLLFPSARGPGPRAAHVGGAIDDYRHVGIAGQCELHLHLGTSRSTKMVEGNTGRPRGSETRRNGSARKSPSPERRLVGDGGGRYFKYRPPPISCIPLIPDPNRDEKI